MRIEVSDDRFREIVRCIVFMRRMTERHHAEGNQAKPVVNEAYLEGAMLLIECLGPHQRAAWKRMTDAEYARQEKAG